MEQNKQLQSKIANNKIKKMDLSKIKKYDDNSLFRFLSKSYSRHKSRDDLRNSTTIQHFSDQESFTKYDQKLRSQSTSFCNTFSRSVTISQNHSLPRPGFLKYRKFSKNESVPLNSSLQTPKKSLQKLQITLNTTNYENFTNFKKTMEEFESSPNVLQEFGLRNLVKRVSHDFVLSEDKHKKTQSATKQSGQYEMLCGRSGKMFSGHKSYNLNSFVITENGKGLFKRDEKNGIKNSIMKRKAKKQFDRN